MRRPAAIRKHHTPVTPAGERGAVLIIGLVILLVITMVGITGQQGTVLQERMAGNMRQNNIALQAAEAALQVGLSYVEEHYPITGTDTGANFVWTSCSVDGMADTSTEDSNPCGRLDRVLDDWNGVATGEAEGAKSAKVVTKGNSYRDVAKRTSAGLGGDIPGVIAQPRLYIEVREDPNEQLDPEASSYGVSSYYTVTAVGFGENEQSRAIVQSTIHLPE
jgi:type IV pilus assembly protein PilX